MEVGIHNHIETESQKEARHAEEHFHLKLSKIEEEQPKVAEKYSTFLLEEQVREAKGNDGKPVRIPLEKREKILSRARITIETGADPVKVERYWNTYTSKDGRPPIGGAQD